MKGDIRAGIGDVWAVALGLVPMGLAFGLLVTQLGFAWWWAPIISVVIYAGSMEFLALSLITAGAAPASAALYALLVNFRHAFYALNYPLKSINSWFGRAFGMYALTDEVYAVVSARPSETWPGSRILAGQATLQIGWVTGGVVGALGGTVLPLEIKGVEFALTALFTVLLIESFAGYKDLSLPLTALVVGGLGWLVSPMNMLMIGMSLYFVVLLVRYFVPPVDAAMKLKVGAVRPREQRIRGKLRRVMKGPKEQGDAGGDRNTGGGDDANHG